MLVRSISRVSLAGGLLVSFGLACAPAGDPRGEPSPEDIRALYPHDDQTNEHFVPNPDFVAQPARFAVKKSKLSREGEVLVIEGDADTVTVGGPNQFGITDANQVAIVQEVLASYPDQFDTIQIFTTFTDEAHQGVAYYQGIRNEVQGIGTMIFDNRGAWGLEPEGRLSGFSNMNSMLMWGNGSFDGLNTVEGFYHGVIAHELSHRWLFRMRFTDPSGNTNDSLLGRDDSHWSRLAHAYGSVHDGNFFVDNGNGTFTNMGTDMGFSPLELYAMGRIPADGVEPFFYLTEATLMGQPLNKLSNIPAGDTVAGTRIDVDVSQVVDEMGPRNPPFGFASPYYRAAFVLVTAPGEARSSWEPHLSTLQQVQADFPETWRRWTGGAMCTKVSELCPEPILSIAGVELTDGGDDIPAPGEQVQVRLSALNTGIGTARGATVRLEPVDATVVVDTAQALNVPAVSEGGSAALADSFGITISSTVACADSVTVRAVFQTAEGPVYTDTFDVNVGTVVLKSDPLNEAPDWTVDPDGTDTALIGAWELGEPGVVTVLGIVTQPGEDHTPGDGKLSFHTGVEGTSFFAENDLDGGKTTLESPIFAIGEAVDPIFTFWGWYNVGDFTAPNGPGPVPGSEMQVLVSNDGGANYTELAVIDDNVTQWTRYAYRIRDAVEPTDRMRFRFVIADESSTGNVEAGIDDLAIIDFVEGCDIEITDPDPDPDPDPNPVDRDEGGCTSTRTRPASGAALGVFATLLLFGLVRRRR